jgi:hypothetical protein
MVKELFIAGVYEFKRQEDEERGVFFAGVQFFIEMREGELNNETRG